MEINTVRAVSTVVVMLLFVAICLWAYSSKRKSAFDEAAQLPFDDEVETTPNSRGKGQ